MFNVYLLRVRVPPGSTVQYFVGQLSDYGRRLKSCGSVLRIGGPILWVEINKGEIGGEDASRNDKNLEKNFRDVVSSKTAALRTH